MSEKETNLTKPESAENHRQPTTEHIDGLREIITSQIYFYDSGERTTGSLKHRGLELIIKNDDCDSPVAAVSMKADIKGDEPYKATLGLIFKNDLVPSEIKQELSDIGLKITAISMSNFNNPDTRFLLSAVENSDAAQYTHQVLVLANETALKKAIQILHDRGLVGEQVRLIAEKFCAQMGGKNVFKVRGPVIDLDPATRSAPSYLRKLLSPPSDINPEDKLPKK